MREQLQDLADNFSELFVNQNPRRRNRGNASKRTTSDMIGLVYLLAVVHLVAAQPDIVVSQSHFDPLISTETFDANHCAVKEGCVVPGTRKLLRFSTEVQNIGNQDIVLGSPVNVST